MFTLIVTEKGGAPKRLEFDKDEITIGRVPGNDIILPKGNVSKRHTRVVRQDGRFFVVDLKSTNGTYLNGRRITTPSVIRPGDKIYVGDFIVMVEASEGAAAAMVQEDPDGDEGTTNLRAEQAQAAIRDAAAVAQQQQSQQPPPPPQQAQHRPSQPEMQNDRRPEVSQVEPLPLDEEPPESSPPPPRPMGPSPRAPLITSSGQSVGAAPGSIGAPRPPMLTQPLGSASAAAMAAAGMSSPPGGIAPAPLSGQNRPTQPPPSRSPLRAPSVPGLSPRAPLPGPRAPGGAGAPAGPPRPSSPPPSMEPARRPSQAGQMAQPPMVPPLMGQPQMAQANMAPPPMAPPPAPMGPPPVMAAPPAMSPPQMAPAQMASAQMAPPPAMSSSPFAPIAPPPSGPMEVEPEPESIEAIAAPARTSTVPPPPEAASPPFVAPVASVPAASAAVAPVASPHVVATVNVAPSVVDAVLQAHKASTPGEPTPIGQEFATLLAEVIAEAKSSGVNVPGDRVVDTAGRTKIRSAVEAAARSKSQLPSGVTPERLVRDAVAELAGTGAFETALGENDVSSVVVESNGRVFVGRGDAIGPSPYWFSSADALARCVDRLLQASGKSRGDGSVTDVVLNDGARLLAVFPPASPSGPTVVYERPARAASLIDLASRNVFSSQAATALGAALVARRNIIVSGPRGSGRSTLLGALVATVSGNDRCLLIERARELALNLPNVTALVANGDWSQAIELGVRLRAQRIALGDQSEAGAAALVAALGTGAEGWLAVVDAPSPVLGLQRLATLSAAGGAYSREDALARFAHVRALVVHTARLGDGSCRVVSIGEARPAENGIRVDESFTLRIDGVNSSGKIDATLVAVPRTAS